MLMLFHQSRGLGGEGRDVCMGWGGGHVQKTIKKNIIAIWTKNG